MYRAMLSRIFVLMCALIMVVSMIGDLIGWFDISSVFPFAFIWLLSISIAVLGVVVTSTFTLSNVLSITLYNFSICAGVGCILIFLEVTFEQGYKLVLILLSILILLYFIAFLLDYRLHKVIKNYEK